MIEWCICIHYQHMCWMNTKRNRHEKFQPRTPTKKYGEDVSDVLLSSTSSVMSAASKENQISIENDTVVWIRRGARNTGNRKVLQPSKSSTSS